MQFSSECNINGERGTVGIFAFGYNFKKSKCKKVLIGTY